MTVEKWDESGKQWEEYHGLLELDQVAKCSPADTFEPFRCPVPTRHLSNGEYMPEMQTEKQSSVQDRIDQLAALRHLGRRTQPYALRMDSNPRVGTRQDIVACMVDDKFASGVGAVPLPSINFAHRAGPPA